MADSFLVPYVRSVWRLLGHRLGGAGRMAIFGAGAHTRWLLSVVRDLPDLPIDYILDDSPGAESLADLPVRKSQDAPVEELDLILISSDQWEEQLAGRARELWGDRIEIVRLYEETPPGPYDKRDDRAEALHAVRSNAKNGARPTERLVVLVADRPSSREAKLGYALRHAGWQVVLLHRGSTPLDLSRSFTTVRSYQHPWQALRMACDYAPVAYHVMACGDYRVAELFVRHRPGPIVVDPYDLLAGMCTEAFFDAHPDRRPLMVRERSCLEQADGVCCRSWEADALVERFGYTFRSYMHIPDGCWNDERSPSRREDGELHVAYAGKIGLETDPDPFAAHGYKLWLAEALAEQGIHYHLYACSVGHVPGVDNPLDAFHRLEASSRFFHWHDPVPPDRLIDELSQYDMGETIYAQQAMPTGAPVAYTPQKFHCCSGNRLYDYIDANLPIIHNAGPGSFCGNIAARHGVGIDVAGCPPDQWGALLRAFCFDNMNERLRRARRAYDVCAGVNDLIAFYHKLSRGAKRHMNQPACHAEEAQDVDSRSQARQALV